ncbi:IQ domain-containing protein IQM1-like [Typha angustifolia]|uniref:IQ domain-containing protein IQM1-like n=1 Tax=Typha angustifolia TaxID=59011 RepID=UPI003C2D3E3E
MGLSLSLLPWSWVVGVGSKMLGLTEEVEDGALEPSCFCNEDAKLTLRSVNFKGANRGIKTTYIDSFVGSIKGSSNFKPWETEQIKPETNGRVGGGDEAVPELNLARCLQATPMSTTELHAAAVKLQKVYKSYRTRRNLADCAVVVEELWWKALDFASLEHSSVSFFNGEKHETASSRWARAGTRAAKVGKGLSKNAKAQKLALQHWLEAIDPRHRYGHNLHLYYDVWFESESAQPFFYWLDIGEGKEVNLDRCSRNKLHQQCIKYLGPKERKAYEVIVDNGYFVFRQSGTVVNTIQGSKWIFVLSTTKALYMGQKKKGSFQHSSFLAGGAIISAGRLVVKEGVLKAIWPYSGHYLPTEENFQEFIKFLRDNNVDLTDVKRCPIDQDDEYPSFKKANDKHIESEDHSTVEEGYLSETEAGETPIESADAEEGNGVEEPTKVAPQNQLSRKWSCGVGPRISCLRDYPGDLQFKALEHVNLSPRVATSPVGNKGPIPSPRPSPEVRLSPRLTCLGFRIQQGFYIPTIFLTLPKCKKR